MTLIQKINEVIENQKNGTTNSDNIYVIDYKKINGGEVKILDSKPDHDSIHLTNNRKIEVFYSAFGDNALKVDEDYGQVKQCECILFPASLNDTDWVLFIETKYTYSIKIALDREIDYPNTMIEQIISTVSYFRETEILPKSKKVFAIVSFPKLIEDFSEAFFTRSKSTPEEILANHKIVIRASKEGEIRSEKRIKI